VTRIVKYPHPALRYESRPVTRIDEPFRSLVRLMFDAMYEAKGIGLAANQVGVPRRFFVLNLTADPAQKDQEQVFINPTIVKRHGQVEEEEGCLSFPGLYGKVRRAKKIKVKAYDLTGNEVEHDAEDLFSRAVQHETDHLDKKLFIDWLDKDDLKEITPKVRDLEIEFRQAQSAGLVPSDADLLRALDELARD
jgi:peptide deformylase